jgi:magnesium chelatase subunit H
LPPGWTTARPSTSSSSRTASRIDALVSLTGFSLIGGPAYNDAQAAENILARLDVPYLAVTPVEFQTLDHWGAPSAACCRWKSTMMVAIPELDGATGSMVYGGRGGSRHVSCHGCDRAAPSQAEVRHDMQTCSERADVLAARVGKLIDLRRSERAQRKVAAVIFNFPPNAGNTGTAAFLAVFESLFNTLRDAAPGLHRGPAGQRGRTARAPHQRQRARVRRAANVHALHRRRRPCAARAPQADRGPVGPGARPAAERRQLASSCWASASATCSSASSPLRLRGRPDAPAVRARLRTHPRVLGLLPLDPEDFGAHAVLHFGTHGALEFMPGKQNGLTAHCWPDRLIGDLPNMYLYASNNPSEGTIAKRRAAATLISYLTPPVAQAGLYKGLMELKAALERYRSLEPERRPSAPSLPPWCRPRRPSWSCAQNQAWGDRPPPGSPR